MTNKTPEFLNSQSELTNEDDFLGAFSGYLRRPMPSAKGVVAQFYGEDGPDADLIVSLGVTKFQNQHIKTSVYWVKDAVGSLKKKPDGYPLIASFSSFIRRPLPKSTGMLATLFAPNGEASDAAHELGFSKYLDSFVHVRLHRFIETDEPTQEPEFINQKIPMPHNLPPNRASGAHKEAAKSLQLSGFFREPLVWNALGGETSYKTWLLERPCAVTYPEECCDIGHPATIPNSSFKQYTYLPICKAHNKILSSNILAIGGKHALESKRSILLVDWATQTLCKNLHSNSLSDLPPQKVKEWAALNNVEMLLPKKYQNS